MTSPGPAFTVYIVDDDPAMRDSLALMLGLLGYATAAFESAEAFLAAWRDDRTGCVVADLRLPGKSGLDLQAELRARGSRIPFVIITAHGDVPSARAAFQSDAVDFLEKPFDDTDLCSAIERGMQREGRRIESAQADANLESRLAKLTPREREVLALVGRGTSRQGDRGFARDQPAHGRGPQIAPDGEARRPECVGVGALRACHRAAGLAALRASLGASSFEIRNPYHNRAAPRTPLASPWAAFTSRVTTVSE